MSPPGGNGSSAGKKNGGVALKKHLEATLPGVQILEVANLTIDGAQARGITLTSTENDTTIGISRLIILDAASRAWEITFFAEASTLERLSRVVQTIFSSFRFLE